MTWSDAFDAMKAGKRVRRKCWDDDEYWFMVEPTDDYFYRRNNGGEDRDFCVSIYEMNVTDWEVRK